MASNIDTKAHTLGKLYADKFYVSSTMKDVEDIRREANSMSIAVTVALFGMNEFVRLTCRSRKYAFYFYEVVCSNF